jgi:hypothetical protein
MFFFPSLTTILAFSFFPPNYGPYRRGAPTSMGGNLCLLFFEMTVHPLSITSQFCFPSELSIQKKKEDAQPHFLKTFSLFSCKT